MVILVALPMAACSVPVKELTYSRPAPGQILFGTDLDPATATMVGGQTTALRWFDTIALAASFPRPVTGTVEVRIAKDGGPARVADTVTLVTPFDTFSDKFHPEYLDGPAHYVFTIVLGSTTLATGEVDMKSRYP